MCIDNIVRNSFDSSTVKLKLSYQLLIVLGVAIKLMAIGSWIVLTVYTTRNGECCYYEFHAYIVIFVIVDLLFHKYICIALCSSLTKFIMNAIFSLYILPLTEIYNDGYSHRDDGECVAADSSYQNLVVTALAVACMLLSFLVTLKWSANTALWRWGTVVSRRENTQSR